jgi:hypothetical protein
MQNRKILMLGSSGITWTDRGPSGTLPNLVIAELSRRRPEVGWSSVAVEIPPAREMPERVAAAVQAHAPDVAVFAPASSYFTYDSVSARVRRKWPWLFRPSRSVADGLRGASGGGMQGGASARGWLFRAPRLAADRLIGAEPYMKVEHAIANVLGAIAVLTARPGLAIVCKLPRISTDLPPEKLAIYKARLDEFLDALKQRCDEDGISYYSIADAAWAAGGEPERVGDGLHASLATRTADADFMAGLILEALARKQDEKGSTVAS